MVSPFNRPYPVDDRTQQRVTVFQVGDFNRTVLKLRHDNGSPTQRTGGPGYRCFGGNSSCFGSVLGSAYHTARESQKIF